MRSLKKNYTIIFMDCEMPVMDGYTATREIRKWEQMNQLQGFDMPRNVIVALTGNATGEDKNRCLDSGMDDYLCKPVSVASFKEKLIKHKVIKGN